MNRLKQNLSTITLIIVCGFSAGLITPAQAKDSSTTERVWIGLSIVNYVESTVYGSAIFGELLRESNSGVFCNPNRFDQINKIDVCELLMKWLSSDTDRASTIVLEQRWSPAHGDSERYFSLLNNNAVPGSFRIAVFCIHSSNDASWRVSFPESTNVIAADMIAVAEKFVSNLSHAEENQKQERAFQGQVLEQMSRNGSSTSSILAKTEQFSRLNATAPIKNFDDWVRHYQAMPLNPPLLIDPEHNHNVASSTNALDALTRYWLATAHGDGVYLHDQADSSGKLWLSRAGIKRAETDLSLLPVPSAQQIYVLMQATAKINGREFVVFYSRHQARDNPEQGFVLYTIDSFEKTPKGYFFTKDTEDSLVTKALLTGGYEGRALGKYDVLLPLFKASDLPSWFYNLNASAQE